MALSGIEIYKLLPKTNCKDCGFPTCMAFALKLATKQVELAACPHVSEETQEELAASAVPPVRLIKVKSNGHEVQVGNEVVLYRHEKTFYNKPGIFFRIRDDEEEAAIKAKAKQIDEYQVNYVGIDLIVDGFAVEAVSGDGKTFSSAISAVRAVSQRPLILISGDPATMAEGLKVIDGEAPLVYAADESNWEEMTNLALQHKASLVVKSDTLESLSDLTPKIKEKGLADLVLDPGGRNFNNSLVQNTIIRRLALTKNFRPLGFPIIAFPGNMENPTLEVPMAAQAIVKYAGFIVMDTFSPETIYPLLVLRENIFTDPQKPIQVQPGLYEINEPKPEDPVLVTTNFSITYFSVANEVEGSGLPAWLLVADAEGMSVLTAWAAGNFDSEQIAKDVKRFKVADKVDNKRIVIPGAIAVISGELEEELPDWEIKVGPREAVDIPSFLKQAL